MDGGISKSRSYNKNLKIIETIAVGNNKLISIVAVGKKYIAVSVGKDDVHFLTEIKEDELKDLSFLDEPDKESAKESFANILEKLKKSHSDRSKMNKFKKYIVKCHLSFAVAVLILLRLF